MEVKERVIDLRQYILYLWENAIVIVLIVALFTFGMAGFSYTKQKKEIVSLTESETANLDAIMTQNHDAFYRLNDVKSYTDAEPPANTYNSSAKLYVEFNYTNIDGIENMDVSSMTSRLQQDALLLLVSNDSLGKVIDKLDLKDYKDMTDLTTSDLGWMVNKNFLGANVMQIVVTDVDPERAMLISEAVIEEFISRTNEFASINSVTIVDSPSKPEIGIKKESEESAVQLRVSKKKLLKYAIVGCAGGVLFIAVIFLLLFIFKDSVRNSLDLSFANLQLFGAVSIKEDKKKENYKRLAYNIALLDTCKVLTIVPVDKKSNDPSLVEGIAEELKAIGKKAVVISGDDIETTKLQKSIQSEKSKNDIILVAVKNIKDYAEATLAATESDAVLLAVTFSKSRMSDVIYAKSEMDKTGTKLAGAVLEAARYV